MLLSIAALYKMHVFTYNNKLLCIMYRTALIGILNILAVIFTP